nr:MAG TPA: hypothetical protein [Caudoviricetes sp.]
MILEGREQSLPMFLTGFRWTPPNTWGLTFAAKGCIIRT